MAEYMKKIIENKFAFLLVLMAVVIVIAVVYPYSNIEKEPAIQVTPSSHDFGDIPQEEVSHVFEVRNTGGSALEIFALSTSCGCTSASIESNTIAPNQSANLTVIFDPKAMGGIEGEVFRIVYIKSNDPEKPEFEVEITANVIKEV